MYKQNKLSFTSLNKDNSVKRFLGADKKCSVFCRKYKIMIPKGV